MNRSMVVGVMLALAGCGKSGPAPDESTKGPAPKAGDAAAAAKSKTPAPDQPVPADVAPPAAPASTFLTHQLGARMTEFGFLGWTADGSKFALAAMYGPYRGPNVDVEPEDDELQVVRMNVVYDAATSKAIAAFRVRNNLQGEHKAKYAAAWDEAKPRGEWKAWREANPLAKSRPATKSPDGAWKLSAKLDRAPARGWRDLDLRGKGGGFSYTWHPWRLASGDETPDDDGPPDSPAIGGDEDAKPRWTFSLASGKTAGPTLHYESPFDSDFDLADPGLFIVGNMRAFWAPTGDRVLLATFQKVDGYPESSEAREAAFFVLELPNP